ncbi:MAG TPA: sialidase family protein [Gemmatimonadota bacterium]|nr:sialidase family protein [Gemmatimonadota bacterium]
MEKSGRNTTGYAGLILLAVVLAGSCRPGEPRLEVGAVEFSTAAWSVGPNLVAAPNGRVILTWLEPAGDETHALKFAVRDSAGWSQPGTIRESDRFFVNWADFPSLAQLAGGEWMVHWLEKVDVGTYAYHVKLAISSDEGETWSEPFAPHRDQSATEHGFVSMVPLSDGGAAVVWLDGRQMAEERAGGEHEGLELGEMSLRATTVSVPGELGEDVLLDSRTCECCQTALVQAADGLVAAYRDRGPSEIRDIAVSRHIDNRWTEPVVVSNDEFYYPGCPVNGPQLAANGDDVVIAWYTAPEQNARTYVAFSQDGGATFGSRIQIDDGDPLGRVDVELLADGTAIVAWLERTETAADVRVRLVKSDGWMGAPLAVSETSESRGSGFPRMARAGDEIVIAWTLTGDDGGVRAAAVQVDR